MNKEEIKSKIKDIIVEKNDVDASEVTDTANFRIDLDMDSLDIVELVMTVEEEFDITITDDEAEKISNLSDCVALVEKHLK